MELTCTTVYSRKALADMGKALRKTTRKKSNRWNRVLGWILMAVCLMGALDPQMTLWIRVTDGIAVALLLAVLFGEDMIGAFFSKRRAMPGMEEGCFTFLPDCYESQITGAVTQWQYETIQALAETRDYLVLVLGKNHAQACDKKAVQGGTAEELGRYLEEKTGKKIQQVGRRSGRSA